MDVGKWIANFLELPWYVQVTAAAFFGIGLAGYIILTRGGMKLGKGETPSAANKAPVAAVIVDSAALDRHTDAVNALYLGFTEANVTGRKVLAHQMVMVRKLEALGLKFVAVQADLVKALQDVQQEMYADRAVAQDRDLARERRGRGN